MAIYNSIDMRPAVNCSKLPLPTVLKEYLLHFEPWNHKREEGNKKEKPGPWLAGSQVTYLHSPQVYPGRRIARIAAPALFLAIFIRSVFIKQALPFHTYQHPLPSPNVYVMTTLHRPVPYFTTHGIREEVPVIPKFTDSCHRATFTIILHAYIMIYIYSLYRHKIQVLGCHDLTIFSSPCCHLFGEKFTDGHVFLLFEMNPCFEQFYTQTESLLLSSPYLFPSRQQFPPVVNFYNSGSSIVCVCVCVCVCVHRNILALKKKCWHCWRFENFTQTQLNPIVSINPSLPPHTQTHTHKFPSIYVDWLSAVLFSCAVAGFIFNPLMPKRY